MLGNYLPSPRVSKSIHIFEDAIRYPYDDGDGLRALAIGSLLTLLGVLVIPTVLVGGYAIRVIRAVVADEPSPPAWTEWGELFVDGLRVTIVSLVYFVVPSILFVGSVGVAVLPFVTNPGNGAAAVGVVAAAIAVISLPLFLAAAYVLPAALVGIAVTGRLGTAFAFGRIWTVVTTGDYAVAWAMAFLLGVGASFLTGLLTGLTLVGGLLGALFSFYALVAGAYLYTEGVDVSRFGADRSPPAADGDAAVRPR